MIRAIIPGKDFLFMTRFCSDEETRHYLKGVSIEPLPDNSVILASTTGSILGAMRLNREQGEGHAYGDKFILANDKTLIRAVKVKKNEHCLIICRDDRVDVLITSHHAPEISDLMSGNFPCAPAASFPASRMYIDGIFPDWKKVMPTDAPIKSRSGSYDTGASYCVGVNPELLALFSANADHPGISFDWDEAKPILVTNSDPPFVGVIMPMGNGMTRETILERRNWLMAECAVNTPAAA